jgi:DNA-binding NarL/FixJ family response regulator
MRIVLAEDSTLLREGLTRLLAGEGHEILAAVDNPVELVASVAETQPDVVVTDVRMPPTHTNEGLRAALEIRERWPEVGVLVLSQYVENRYAAELITSENGRVGYLLKDRVVQVEDFLDALERVASGGAAFDPDVVRQLLSRTRHTDPLATLSPRERDVLQLMAEGLTNASIAQRLHFSQSAAEKHVNSIFDKLGLANSKGTSRRVLAVVRYLSN